MSAFELADGPRALNGGAVKYDIRQLFPQTAAVSGTRPGVSGATTGQTTFQWNDDNLWWIPSMSYFDIRGHFTDTSGNALGRGPALAIADNWVPCLFSQIQAFCNSQTVSLVQNPPQTDTVLTYATVDHTFLKSFGTASGVGVPYTTRALNVGQWGAGTGNAGNLNEVVAMWRPPMSLFDCPTGIPPGCQWRVDFSWSPFGEQLLIESAATPNVGAGGAKIAGTDYYFVLDEFTMYKATIAPDMSIPKPMFGYIELNETQTNTYPLSGGSTLQVNCPLPSTCNKMWIVVQDNNALGITVSPPSPNPGLAHGQNGLKAITSFDAAVSTTSADRAAYVQNLYVLFPELGYQFPNPTYNLTGQNTGGSNARQGWERAYADFITVSRGSSGGTEGSVPFGCFDTGVGAAVIQINETVPVTDATGTIAAQFNIGDPNNDQQSWNVAAFPAAAPVAGTYGNNTALWGWLGRCPGPIFAIPVIRPRGVLVTNANISLQFSQPVVSANVFIIMSYSMGIACEKDASEKYQFQIMRGL